MSREAAIQAAQAASRLAKLTSAIPPREIELPAGAGKALLVILDAESIQECMASALLRFEALKIPPGRWEMYVAQHLEDEVFTQLLARALRVPGKPEECFAVGRTPEDRAHDVRAHMTVDQRTAIYERYRDYAVEMDPTPEELGPDAVAAIVELIKKKDRAGLCALGSSTLASYALTSGGPPASSATGRSESSSS